MIKRCGAGTFFFPSRPCLLASASVAGPMENEGLLTGLFDEVLNDMLDGNESWEQCESGMMRRALDRAFLKAGLPAESIDVVLAGDLLNQLMSTHFAVRSLGLPFLGLYGACSTFAESILTGSVLVDGGYAQRVAAAVSSHHGTAERQFRFPTEQGVQRPMFAQWTVTGSGAVVIAGNSGKPAVTRATVGKIVDLGIKDPNAMGAAMAPAAADTLRRHFESTGRRPEDYDIIATGDLGSVGKQLLSELVEEKGYDIRRVYEDCGCLVYRDDQDAHAGASGCACSALVFCSRFYPDLEAGKIRRMLLVCTGSLHSPTSYQQKESIPGIAHAVEIES